MMVDMYAVSWKEILVCFYWVETSYFIQYKTRLKVE